MDISEYAAASLEERRAERAVQAQRASDAIERLRQMTEVEMAEIAAHLFPGTVMLRVGMEKGIDVTCMGVGFYNQDGERLALLEHELRRGGKASALLVLIEGTWTEEGGREAWPEVNDESDTDDFPSGIDDVYEIRLPRLP